jgi:hypothetical protein
MMASSWMGNGQWNLMEFGEPAAVAYFNLLSANFSRNSEDNQENIRVRSSHRDYGLEDEFCCFRYLGECNSLI